MKKMFSILLVLSMVLSVSFALAEDAGMGVQVIGGPDISTAPVSLDDIQIEASVDIDGYATLSPLLFEYADSLYAYQAGKKQADYYWDNFATSYWSGNDAQYACLRIDITNLNTKAKNFLENVEVKVVYDDTYEYGGWFYQYNYDNGTYDRHAFKNEQNIYYVIDKADVFAIGPMYTGHYVFGCTLPNAIVESKKPLRMEIMMDGNEITYNIRK